MEEKYGEVEEMNVCDNLGDHLVGNVYVKVGGGRRVETPPTWQPWGRPFHPRPPSAGEGAGSAPSCGSSSRLTPGPGTSTCRRCHLERKGKRVGVRGRREWVP